jgi:pyruvate,water dikinase
MTTATSTPECSTQFPVPADLTGFWVFDQVHAPRPVTPLSEEILLGALTEGFCTAMREVGYPSGIVMRVVNRYGYLALLPHVGPDGTPLDLPAWDEQSSAASIDGLGERWEREWLPALLPGLERVRTLDYGALSDAALLTTLDDLRRDLIDRWRIHGYLVFSYQAASTFDDFYQATFAPVDPTEPYLLLSGFETRALDTHRGLWRLSRTIRQSDRLTRLLTETAPTGWLPALEDSDEGRALLAELGAFLGEHGWRIDAILELAEPMWREDLTIPLNTLRGLIELDDADDPDARLQRIVQRRERLLAQARASLADDPARLAHFDTLYQQARHHVIIDENHNFYIDQMGNAAMRLPTLELGRRLVRHGVVDRVDDVFMLTTAQIRTGLQGVDQRAVGGAVRAELARWATITPPPTLGEPPTGGVIDPFLAAMMKTDIPPEPREQTAMLIRGTAASPGTARGRARVARSLEEASTIEPGQILVCEMTLPPWSILFSTVSAVVTDTGGVLSHSATVAREYGIPCVVGTVVGTTAIRDGMLLLVDGTAGEVTIVAEPV